MTDRYLRSLIDRLNKKGPGELIFLRPLSDRVTYAKVWIRKTKIIDEIDYSNVPYDFYFIKNEEGFYVATVLDMKTNLHWFVLPHFRKQGHLTRGLRETILYHIFQDEDRTEQRITIDEVAIGQKIFLASESVAKSLGFVKINQEFKSEYILKRELYTTDEYLHGLDTEIDEKRLNDLKKSIDSIYRSLWIIQTEIEMKLGFTEYSEELKRLVNEIKNHKIKIQDAWWINTSW